MAQAALADLSRDSGGCRAFCDDRKGLYGGISAVSGGSRSAIAFKNGAKPQSHSDPGLIQINTPLQRSNNIASQRGFGG